VVDWSAESGVGLVLVKVSRIAVLVDGSAQSGVGLVLVMSQQNWGWAG